jgi:hypothetical protein
VHASRHVQPSLQLANRPSGVTTVIFGKNARREFDGYPEKPSTCQQRHLLPHQTAPALHLFNRCQSQSALASHVAEDSMPLCASDYNMTTIYT